ncbi:hypothetical protein [Azospirillum argentinense]|uniref:hypothetical protein n=1 Tax=Azospirillum argentinense TaxID=2970906 RepID=UPI0010C092DA|nr:hypothetical protein [Azospirillum argentinense]
MLLFSKISNNWHLGTTRNDDLYYPHGICFGGDGGDEGGGSGSSTPTSESDNVDYSSITTGPLTVTAPDPDSVYDGSYGGTSGGGESAVDRAMEAIKSIVDERLYQFTKNGINDNIIGTYAGISAFLQKSYINGVANQLGLPAMGPFSSSPVAGAAIGALGTFASVLAREDAQGEQSQNSAARAGVVALGSFAGWALGTYVGVGLSSIPGANVYGGKITAATSIVGGQIGKNLGEGIADHFGLPIIFDLDGDGITFSSSYFDIDNDGQRQLIGWMEPGDGILVVDWDGDGLITRGEEIDFARLGLPGMTDLEGLAYFFDKNLDGKLNSADPLWGDLKIWNDQNLNGVTDANELRKLSDYGIVDINLSFSEPNFNQGLPSNGEV